MYVIEQNIIPPQKVIKYWYMLQHGHLENIMLSETSQTQKTKLLYDSIYRKYPFV